MSICTRLTFMHRSRMADAIKFIQTYGAKDLEKTNHQRARLLSSFGKMHKETLGGLLLPFMPQPTYEQRRVLILLAPADNLLMHAYMSYFNK